jgi:hypothetical protein
MDFTCKCSGIRILGLSILTCLDNIVDTSIWVYVECEVAIIAASIPALRAIFTKTSFVKSTNAKSNSRTAPESDHSQLDTTDIKVITSVEWSSDHEKERNDLSHA